MQKNRVSIILGSLCLFNILAWIGIFQLNYENLEVTFFDVGQGDSIFIETPQNHQILIDGGPTPIVLEKLGKAMPFWDRTIDLIVLTHPDFDHISGLIEVLRRYQVENILWTGISCETAECQEWHKLIEEEGSSVYFAKAGQQIEGGGVLFNILYPFESMKDQEINNTNNTSIVASLVYAEISFLFTGDIYQSVERELIKERKGIDVDFLKVGHHGSKNSNAQEFIEAVSPEVAVISVGKDNKYGHPSLEALQNLMGVSIVRTDLVGDVKIVTDGKKYLIQ